MTRFGTGGPKALSSPSATARTTATLLRPKAKFTASEASGSGVVFSGSLDGHLRAYSDEDGRIIWDYDTGRDFETVNEVKANDGSLGGWST